MGKIKEIASRLKDKNIIALDTMIFIYHFERHKVYQDITWEIFSSIENGAKKGITSIISLLEILIKPKKGNYPDLVEEYKFLFRTFPNLKVVNVDEEVVNHASTLRAKYNIKIPDAIQIATAISNNAEVYLTNDGSVKKVNEIETIILDDFLR